MRLLERIWKELPEIRVQGILYERRRHKTFGRRLRDILKRLPERHYLPFAFDRALHLLALRLRRFGEAFLLLLHACPRNPNGTLDRTIEDLACFAKEHGCAVHVTLDMHTPESLAFVRECQVDLGILYGTRLLKPGLYEIPRLGSINLHKRKLPDYRGGGPVGLWELLDGQREIGITVHQVSPELDAGAILRTASIPIEAYDDLESLALKAATVGNDTLLAALCDFAENRVQGRPQEGPGRMFRIPSDHQLFAYHRMLRKTRAKYRMRRTRSLWKLLVRTALLYPSVALRNWSYRRRSAFPIVILYHHLITDRPHHLGMPTSAFARQAQFLQKYYRLASLGEAMRMLKEGHVPTPTVVLTFDDGYAENYVNLRAVAKEYRLPVFFFLSTGHITDQIPFGHDVRCKQEGFAPLTWVQVRHLCQRGFSFGGHTRRHFDCGSTDVHLLEDEIVGCKQDLERHLGSEVDCFSFPWGMPANMSVPAQELAHRAFPYVFGAAGGMNFPGSDPQSSLLNRCSHPLDLWDLELLLQGVFDLEHLKDLLPR
jgi:peptidoglycan/xylan/chitin deacetylase (PgdA/CDA1 family)